MVWCNVDFIKWDNWLLLVAKLLQGINIKELPIENTRNSYIAINLNRSLNLNINISQNILSKIDMLIE